MSVIKRLNEWQQELNPLYQKEFKIFIKSDLNNNYLSKFKVS